MYLLPKISIILVLLHVAIPKRFVLQEGEIFYKRSKHSPIRKRYVGLSTIDHYLFGDAVEIKIVPNFTVSMFEGAIKNLPQLKILRLKECGIPKLFPRCFLNLPKLEVVHLQHNDLSSIKKGVFNYLQIRELWLHKNEIETIEPGAFDNMPNLQTIRLSDNLLSQWNSRWFANTPNLRQMFMKKNEITELPARAFANIRTSHKENGTELVDLQIFFSWNKISYIHPEALHGIDSLHELCLRNNKLQEIDKKVFKHMTVLHKLRLRRNKLNMIDRDSFENVEKMEVLDLAKNKIECLPYEIVEKAAMVNVTKNKFDCDCLCNLVEKLRNNRMQNKIIDGVCNRTYYGDVGKTYDLRVVKSSEMRLPFLCHLTFTANGQSHGDIVQIIFDEFKVGRYEASALDGCPDGYMQLSELGRPFTGGSWCGSSSGPAAYYSETSTVTVTVKLFGSPQIPFKFQLRYRFVSRREAVVRFGSPAAPLERGQVAPGTYCTRQFEECYRKPCRLQSPNYPGMYPRNVSCYWSLRQKFVPTCKHAMIAVRQEAAHKMHMKRSINVAGLNKTARALRAWRDCTGERDHLIFYDGGSTNDPVLAKYCGGDWLPKVVSRGPEMLVAFHSSPFSIPLHSPPSHSPLRGFELDVDVIFADSDSLDYSRESHCEFDVNATSPDSDEVWTGRGRKGRLLSPRHSLPPNTTCTYKFQGYQHDLVWVSFISYSQRALLVGESAHALLSNSSLGGGCSTRLRIWDGTLLLEDKCDEPPKLCDHSALSNATRVTRPCALDESYLSSGRNLVLQHHTEDGTALHPASFRMKYEFIDMRLGGESWPGKESETCYRIFRKNHLGELSTPRNVFLYGRGGAKDLHCVYRFEADQGERVRLIVNNASFGLVQSCETLSDPHSGRPICEHYSSVKVTELSVWELPWKDVRMPRGCICDNSSFSSKPLVFLSASRTLELHFTAKDMNITEDFTVLHFHASFEVVKMPDCPRKQRVRGYGGDVQFNTPPIDRSEMLCVGMPWLVEARYNRSLFLLSWGAFLPLKPRAEETTRCPTNNRVLIYSGRPPKLVRAVCPAEPGAKPLAVHVFSEDWWGEGLATIHQRPPNFLVEWVSNEPGISAFSWLEISRSRSSLLQQLQVPVNATANETELECPHKCPELDACIGASLWCDGKNHCPSGWDESEAQCGAASKLLTSLPGAALAAAAAVLSSLLLLLCLTLHRLRARRRRRLAKKKLLTGPRLLDNSLNS